MKSILMKLLCAAVLNSVAFAASAEVVIEHNDAEYVFDNEVRLASVLQAIPDKGQWHWPSVGLYSYQTETPSKLKQQILLKIKSAQHDTDASSKALLASFAKQIAAWNLLYRVDIQPDLLRARFDIDSNPQLPAGRYYLYASAQRPKIEVINPANDSLVMDITLGQPIAKGLEPVSRHIGVSTDEAWLVMADGTLKKLGINYWNQKSQQELPGMRVYLPLKPRVFNREINEINNLVHQLLAHKVSS